MDRDLSLCTYLAMARSVLVGLPFRADDAFVLIGALRAVCPVSLADTLSEERMAELDAAEDHAYVDLLARGSLAELVARLELADRGAAR